MRNAFASCALALALLVGAGAAHAATKYVRADGVASWASATSHASASTSASLATANANANDDDVVYFAGGSYGILAPNNSGSAGHRITFIGDPANPANVTFTNISLAPQDYITVRGCKSTNGFDMSASSPTNVCVADSVVQCVILTSVGMNGAAQCVFADNTVGVAGAANTDVHFTMYALPLGTDLHCGPSHPAGFCGTQAHPSDNIIERNTMYLGADAGNYAFTTAYAINPVIRFNRIQMTFGPTATSNHFTNNFRMVGGTYRGNRWTFLNSHSTDTQRYILAFRDSCRFITFDRDSFIVDPASTQSCKIQIAASGTITAAKTTGYISFDSCYIDLSGSGDDDGELISQVRSTNISFTNTTVTFGDGQVTQFLSDSLMFDHNTVYKRGNGAIWDNTSTSDMTNATVTNNIFAAEQGSGGGVYRWLKYSGTHNFNYNLAYSFASPTDSSNAVANNSNTHLRLGPGSAWCLTDGNDCASRWGNPAFADAAGGNFALGAGSLGLGLGPAGYVGAIAPASTDSIRPAPIATLATSAPTPSTITLSWTAVGDDSLTGTATSYLIRRNFGASITSEGLWNAATVVTSPPTPQVAGSAETKVVTGLSQNANYYFAVRAVDESGHMGAIGFSPLGTTAPDVTRPAPITTLTATTIAPNAVRLNWTAVGDDSLTGQAVSYEIRRALSPISDLTAWNAATVVTMGLGANTAGTAEVYTVASLLPATTYYFAIRVGDEVPNVSALSNSPGATTFDNVLPATISDLNVKGTTGTTATLSWTSTGDDGSVGTASFYEVRYRLTSPIVTEGDWVTSTNVTSGLPTPQAAGNDEEMTISGLTSDRTYYFAVRATDESGNRSLISNSPAGVTSDITAPGQITVFTSTGVTTTTVTLRWTAVGDDGLTGTAATTVCRYTTAGPITNETAWGAATFVPGMPTPGVAGTIQSVTVTGLTPGVTYHFAIRSTDEAGNVGALSASLSRATIASDIERPATPSIVASAWPGVADGVRVIFTAVGDDSLTGTATSYSLRYRKDAGLTESTWQAASLLSRTYRVTPVPAPRAAGLADTIFVRGLRLGETLWFGLKVADELGLESALSGIDSVAIPARLNAEINQPGTFAYMGAGPGTVPASYPFVNLAHTAVDTSYCRAASLFDGASYCPEFADYDGTAATAGTFGDTLSLAAWRTMRQMNASHLILGEPPLDAVYIRQPADSSARYDFRFQSWRAARIAGGGWPTGAGRVGQSWSPGGYTDSTGARGFLWTNVPGYKGWFYQTYNIGRLEGVSKAGVAGLSNWNVNIAYQPTPGNFPVADSLADVAIRHFVWRQNVDGSWTYDGIRWDLFGQSSVFSALQYEDIDFARAGYATKALFDSAWTQAAVRICDRVARAAVDAGRPDFILAGNGGSMIAVDHLNGWMNEGFPTLQGGSWFSNVYWVVGGMFTDARRSGRRPYAGVTFTFECLTSSCDLVSHPDSAATRKRLRYGLGTVAAVGYGMHMIGPAPASAPLGGSYPTWQFDEYAVDTITNVAKTGRAGRGYLGRPTSGLYYTAPTIWAGGDRMQGRGSFETATLSSWWTPSVSSTYGSLATVTDTVASGTYALRARVWARSDADWRVALNPSVFAQATTGQTLVLTFKARSDRPCAIQAHVIAKTSNLERASWANGSAIAIEPGGWNTYRIVGTCTSTDSVGASIWFATDSVATVWVDDMTLHVGGSRGGSAVREYRRGVVVVNPQATADTVTFGRYVRRITAAPGRPTDVNTGELIAPGSPIIVPSTDARFLLFPLDSLRPSRVTTLVANGATTTSALVSWTAPGNDSTTGTATSYQFRRSPNPIVTETDWSNASPITPAPTPAVAGSSESVTVTGLSTASVYWFAVRAYDAAGYVGAISNSDSVTTLAPAAPDPCVDIARPGRVDDLIASWPGVKYVRMTLTKPGPRQFVGSIDSVRTQIRRSASPITSDAEWNAATVVLNNVKPLGLAVGSNGAITDTVVALAGTWWYAWRDSNTTSHMVGCLSNTDSVTTAPDSCEFYGRPGVVSDLVATGEPSIAGQVTIALNLPGEWQREGDGDVTTIEVRRSLSPITTIAEWNAATSVYEELVQNIDVPGAHAEIPISGLPEGVASWFAVRATNATSGLTSCLSNTDSATAALPPGDPPNAAFSVVPTSGQQALTVVCQDHSAGSPTSWEWYARRLSDEADPQISGDQNPSFVFERVGVYLISMQTYNADGSDTASATVTVTCNPPSPMSTIRASAISPTAIAITYTEPGDNGGVGTPELIEVRYVDGGTFDEDDWETATPVAGVPAPTSSGTVTSVTVTGLSAGRTYTFAARATDQDGCQSAFSTTATVSTRGTYDRTIGLSVGFDRVRVRVGGRR